MYEDMTLEELVAFAESTDQCQLALMPEEEVNALMDAYERLTGVPLKEILKQDTKD